MRKSVAILALGGTAMLLSACGSSNILSRNRPDEMAVSRQAPLVVPPDFALVPPTPGAPRPQSTDASTQALDALFGGPAPRSQVEADSISRAGTAAPGIRSTVGDPGTLNVAKGAITSDIIAAPEGDGQDAQAVIPG